MAQLTEEICSAWRALAGESGAVGWRSIRVTSGSAASVMAARHFPENTEALVVGFRGAALPPAEKLPDASGFTVVRVEQHGDAGNLWLALTRKQAGKQDLFTSMVADVAGALESARDYGGKQLLQLFLSRVRAWQAFMRRGTAPLGPEAEAGLVGELIFLDMLLEHGVAAEAAVDAWEGPLDAPQDFVLGTGAVEVKATVAPAGFPVKIGALEQLDDSILSPLFLAGERLTLSDSGMTLPDWAAAIRDRLAEDPFTQGRFDGKLLAAGYSQEHAGHYVRRFLHAEQRLHLVDDTFPRLVPGTVPKEIHTAMYAFDLGHVARTSLDLDEVLKKLGAV